MFDWKSVEHIIVQDDLSVKKRLSSWTVICLDCTSTRKISYCQAWNIARGSNSGRCQSCAEKNKEWGKGKYSRGGKEKAPKRKLEDVLKYRNMFDNPAKRPEVKEKMRAAKLGKKGSETNRWEGGKTQGRKLEMSSDAYKQLRKEVLVRDGFKCTQCPNTKKLEMDHIKEWCNYPELRYEPTNCRILCQSCHTKTDNYGHKALKKKVSIGL